MLHLMTMRLRLRVLAQSSSIREIDAYFADLEQQDGTAAGTSNSLYAEALLSGTLFDYSTVPYPPAAHFLQAWIAACPDCNRAHLVFVNFCFGSAAYPQLRLGRQRDSGSLDRRAVLACESAAAALLKAMTLSPRPVAARVTVMQLGR